MRALTTVVLLSVAIGAAHAEPTTEPVSAPLIGMVAVGYALPLP